MTDLLHWGSAGFPKRLAFWAGEGDRFGFALRRHGSALALGAAALSLAVSGVLAIGFVRYERLAAAQDAAMRRAENANANLQDALARLRDQLGAANQTLTTTQSRIAALNDEAHQQLTVSEQAATSKTDRIAQLSHALEQAQRELHLAEAQRVTLMARLSKSEADAAEGRTRQQQAQSGVEQWQKKVQQLTADRDRAAAERDQLRARLSKLEQKLSMQATPQPQAQQRQAQQQLPPQPERQQRIAAVIVPRSATPFVTTLPNSTASPVAPAPAAPTAQAARSEPARPTPTVAVATGRVAQLERVLASTGVDVRRLFAQFGVSGGEGGPFVPVPPGGVPTLSPQKLAALARLVNVLPVSAPLTSYRVGSPFGVRGDPMNGDREFHTGIDMLAPYMSPVYATAPGVVIFAGYRNDYGKVVEIDHGHGITTRYAHLHRFVVSVGEHVAARQQIGFLGSTGRATGPHVHYEVLVNGEPQDPEKFFGLTRLVQVAQH